MVRICSTILLFCLSFSATANECAHNFEELDKTERLKTLKPLIPEVGRRGYVNKTQGSYIDITASTQNFVITFFTTGLFDLYGIRREGPLKFCDDGKKLLVIGLDREQTLYIDQTSLQFDERGPRQSFQEGPMPLALQKIHNIREQTALVN